ncbi:MAG: SDR family NAD(P)-dependent oxidoreductase [Chloroflexota bacterium]
MVAGHEPRQGRGGGRAVRSAEGDAIAVAMDATVEADAEHAVQVAVERYGKLDLVVNCVGGGAGKVLFDAQAYRATPGTGSSN